jgi:pimeloyl-ACP methyl ester carboxylesterase
LGSVARRVEGSSRVRRALSVALVVLAGLLIVAAGAQAVRVSPSLPAKEGSAPRPGPEVLYEPLAQAPQLENAPGSGWHAKPILVSGASAYRHGEFLYQGYIYDDHGAKEVLDPTNPMISPGGDSTGGDTFSEPDGTYTYPTGPGYDENAANLVELRVRPMSKATAFRITLNTLENPDLVATSIAIGGTPGETHPFPFGANVSAPAQYFLTVHGETATLTDAASGAEVSGPPPTVGVDLARRQITVEVPHSEWNPGTSTVRLAAGVGLWNAAADSYLLPGAVASATQPGGAGVDTTPPAFFDVAFRFNAQEPVPGTPGAQTELSPAYWRESAQAQALATGDISSFHAEVDFAKLKAKTEDDMPNQPTGVPQTGVFDRILASHYADGQGADYATGGCGSSTACIGEMRGQLLPYAIYVPSGTQPSAGWGATLLLHSLSANYNQFAGSKNQAEFAARGGGSIVFTPSGRGPDGWYYDHAGADTFEVWADVAAHYALNPSFTDIAGYSMGGYGTYKFASQFPDLFARAQPTVGPPALGIWVPPAEPTGGEQSLTQRMLGSVRNVPFLIWDETTDELVPIAGVLEQVKAFDELGYRYEFDQFQAGEHLTLALNDEFAPAAAFLGTETVDSDPAHVTYVYNPTMDFAADGTTAGHAYWVYGVSLRDSSGTAPLAKVDVRSQGFGVGDPVPGATQLGAGALTGGTIPAIPYTSQSKAWGPAPSEPAHDALNISATNVAHVTIDAARAKVDCKAQLNVTTDGPLTVTLEDCHGGGRKTITASFG